MLRRYPSAAYFNATQNRLFFGNILIVVLLLLFMRIYHCTIHDAVSGPIGYLDSIRSDFFVFTALASVSLGLLKWRPDSKLVFFAAQAFFLFFIPLEITSTAFSYWTGTSLDYGLLVYSVENFPFVMQIARAMVGGWIFWMLLVTTLFIVGHPWIASSEDGERVERGPRARSYFLAAPLFLVLAALPTLEMEYRRFARNVWVSLGHQAWRSVSAPELGTEGTMKLDEAAPAYNAKLKKVGEKQKNVVVFIMESTRADALGLYNPGLGTSPYLDSVAKESFVADRAYTIVPHTSKALVAILCGHEPLLSMHIGEALGAGAAGRCMADLFREQGYNTAFFQSAQSGFEFRFNLIRLMGYEHFIGGGNISTKGYEPLDYLGYEDEVLLPPSKAWLDKNKEKPFFATYLTLVPHHSYHVPKRYGMQQFSKSELFNQYLNTIAYQDKFLEKVMKQYKERGLLEDTIFVFVSDHGEAFGDHGGLQHDSVMHDEVMRIALMIHAPGQVKASREARPVSQLDLLPTIVSLSGHEFAQGKYKGLNLLDPQTTWPSPRRLYGQTWYARQGAMILEDDVKLIHHFGGKRDKMYNLTKDPKEKVDLITPENQAKRDAMLKRWNAWRQGVQTSYRMLQQVKDQKNSPQKTP